MGDAAPKYTVIYDGFVNGEDASVLTGTLSFTCDYTSEKTEQEYAIIPSGLTGNDYAITWINGTLKAARRYSSSSDSDSDDSDASGSSGNKGTENKGTQNTNSQAKKRISQQIPKEDRYLIHAAFSPDPSSQRAIWQRAEHRRMDSATG